MKIVASSPEDYIAALPEERRSIFSRLRETIRENLPEGFEEVMIYDMISYVVPKSVYSPGYHVDPSLPLPFINIASQKNFIALYHMGIYADNKTSRWFVEQYPQHSASKLDMGKSCIRFKNIDQVPLELIGELVKKISVEDWIRIYEDARNGETRTRKK